MSGTTDLLVGAVAVAVKGNPQAALITGALQIGLGAITKYRETHRRAAKLSDLEIANRLLKLQRLPSLDELAPGWRDEIG